MRRFVETCWLAVMIAACTGCAGWQSRLLAPSVAAQRQARQGEALRSFEMHRDAAQLSAALDRWKCGEAATCEAMLASVVARRPDYLDARLQLGHVLWSRGDAAAAEPHFRAVLEKQPERAEAHHALGLLLDATGRGDEARQHFSRASQIEPDNEVYRLTQDSTTPAVR